ncbi:MULTISPECIES: low temperature requirement protein A [unclassified Micromonospora]|uniref:low temperature requirement protein A n=1 Tax=unclassified Micromonospora TaxID=2617518 RepID=UPI0022B606FF|nr:MULTISPECIES: low temperature requirement protein A [unclassified Micromonospora]MCZ7421744.1 low temperature requirement protein A [Verrucosispora sp. WMMA2121]WBB93584.1 low temperature requirement protein A [Verrucosispora sp. WMMC514]
MELFFDLVMVFALNRLVARAASGLQGPCLEGSDIARRWTAIGQMMLLFAPLIWTWMITAYVTARFNPRVPQTQWVVLGTAFALLVMGASVPYAFEGAGLAFALAFAVTHVGRVLVTGYFVRGHPLARMLLRPLLWSVPVALLWTVGALNSGSARVMFWTLAVVVDYCGTRSGWPLPRLGRGRESAWALSPHHLADRFQQLVLIALGETILAAGISYASGQRQPGGYESIGLVVAFVLAVLLWRIYFHRVGQVLKETVANASDPAALGRFIGAAHVVVILGIVFVAVGHELIQLHPMGPTYPAWLVMIIGGPVCYLLGRAALERAVFDRISPRRWVGIALLLATGVPLLTVPPLAAGITAAVVLLGVALLDILRSAGRPPELPHPAETRTNLSWWGGRGQS